MSDDRASGNAAQDRAINRARWDELAALHGQDAYYDSAALIAGADSLTEEESAAVGDVAGLDVLRVQCHLGFDAISLARRGARVTGVDFSTVALERGAALARRCGADVAWVLGDATDLPGSLAARFELAYATVGVLCWIDDVAAWMRSVNGTLRPGGRLVLLDAHPLADMIDTVEPLAFGVSYACEGGYLDVTQGSYADRAARLRNPTAVTWTHSLGEIVTAAADAGMRVDALVEHLDSSFEHPPGVPSRESDGRWRLRVGGQALPLLFILRARRPT